MQDKALAYGLYGAVVCRAVFVGLGAVALAEFRGVLLVFAGILLATSAKILLGGEEDEDDDPSKNAIVRWVNSQSLVPATDAFDDEDPSRFFTIDSQGIRRATPLLAAVACLELSDVVFAVDSVPAVFGVSEDPFIVYTSNMFAILGLRAWYGCCAGGAGARVPRDGGGCGPGLRRFEARGGLLRLRGVDGGVAGRHLPRAGRGRRRVGPSSRGGVDLWVS